MNYQQAIEAVKTPETNYFDRILKWSRWWVKDAHGFEFTTEKMREIFESTYAEAIPQEPRVYGAVIKSLQNEGLISHERYEKAKRAISHGRPISVWRVK
jgi:hypothetical protein